MDLGIRGRKAIVAGGSAGLGRATATALAREGALVQISARNLERLQKAAAEISAETGNQVTFVQADHSTAEGRKAVLETCPAPDILVTTLSPPTHTPDFRQITEQDWINAFQSGVVGPIELMREVIAGMAERKWGRIVNIVSVAAKYPVELRLLSGAPRTALASYTSVVGRKVARDNVIINNLLPGMYLTEAAEAREISPNDTSEIRTQRDAEFARKWRIPAGRRGTPADFGNVAATFCADFANFTVGQNIVVDGGAGRSIF